MKHCSAPRVGVKTKVAPFTGAWIETKKTRKRTKMRKSRTLHGCVD